MNFFACPFSIFPIPEPETYALLPTGLDLTGVRQPAQRQPEKNRAAFMNLEWNEYFRTKHFVSA